GSPLARGRTVNEPQHRRLPLTLGRCAGLSPRSYPVSVPLCGSLVERQIVPQDDAVVFERRLARDQVFEHIGPHQRGIALGRIAPPPRPRPPPGRPLPSALTGPELRPRPSGWTPSPPARRSRSPAAPPGCPPHSPHGGQLRRRACSKSQRPSPRLRTCMSMPSPP